MARRADEIEDDVAEVLESAGPSWFVYHVAKVLREFPDLAETPEDLRRAAKLLHGVADRMPKDLGRQHRGTLAETRKVKQLLGAHRLVEVIESAGIVSRDWAEDAYEDGDDDDGDEWNRAGEVFEWIEDKLAAIGIL